ncbi:MAG: GerMN domain-containing protein [Desulfotomaculaceae bacterium]|nr:GerMN domain-containing protein [Desulfotomaculaceae bacterium]
MLKTRWMKPFLLVVGLVAAAFLLGANSPIFNPQVENPTGNTSESLSQAAGEEKREVVLYFSDEQAMYLMPEKRQAAVKEDNIGEAVVQELIKGPDSTLLKRTLPEDTRLLSLSVKQETAYVDFSKEINNSNFAGSAGEIALVYSVVNSLAEIPGIKMVQFLVEGKEVETLYGHIDTGNPISPDLKLVKTGTL